MSVDLYPTVDTLCLMDQGSGPERGPVDLSVKGSCESTTPHLKITVVTDRGRTGNTGRVKGPQ